MCLTLCFPNLLDHKSFFNGKLLSCLPQMPYNTAGKILDLSIYHVVGVVESFGAL